MMQTNAVEKAFATRGEVRWNDSFHMKTSSR